MTEEVIGRRGTGSGGHIRTMGRSCREEEGGTGTCGDRDMIIMYWDRDVIIMYGDRDVIIMSTGIET